MIWLKLGAALALSVAVAAVVYQYNTAIAKAQKLTTELEQARQETARIAKERDGWIEVVVQKDAEMERYERAITARDARARQLEKERNDARRSLDELLRQPEVKPWADTPLPAAVIERLRLAANGGKQAATGIAPRTPAGDIARDGGSAGVRR